MGSGLGVAPACFVRRRPVEGKHKPREDQTSWPSFEAWRASDQRHTHLRIAKATCASIFFIVVPGRIYFKHLFGFLPSPPLNLLLSQHTEPRLPQDLRESITRTLIQTHTKPDQPIRPNHHVCPRRHLRLPRSRPRSTHSKRQHHNHIDHRHQPNNCVSRLPHHHQHHPLINQMFNPNRKHPLAPNQHHPLHSLLPFSKPHHQLHHYHHRLLFLLSHQL